MQLKRKAVGLFQLAVGTKGWFTGAAANLPATSTRLTVTIGTLCFTLPATRKLADMP